jgi:hypothetical protein
MNGDYHAAIGFPDGFTPVSGRMSLRYTSHVQDRAQTHRYGPFELPDAITITEDMYNRDPFEAAGPQHTKPHVFEIHVENGVAKKANVRYMCDDEFDQIAVVGHDGTLITAWLNRRNDTHDTLDTSKYVSP